MRAGGSIRSHRRGVLPVSGVVPEHKALRRSVLGIKRRLQSTGTQRVVGVEKDNIFTVRSSQSGVAGGGHAAVLLMQDRHAGVSGGPAVAQTAAVVGAAVVHENTAQPAYDLLCQNAGHTAVQRGRGLVDRHDHAEGRLAHWVPPFSVTSCTMRTNSS